jgi:hypothetical protein
MQPLRLSVSGFNVEGLTVNHESFNPEPGLLYFYRLPDLLHSLYGDGLGPRVSLGYDLLDLFGISFQLFPSFPHRFKTFFQTGSHYLFAFYAANTGLSTFSADFFDSFRVCVHFMK